MFALLPTVVLLLAAEGLVRWWGAAERCPAYEDEILWACDPILYFKLNPGQRFGGKPLSREGFRGPDFGPRRPGVTRLLALGDSCTYGVLAPTDDSGFRILDEPYPARLDRLAAERLGRDGVEVYNAAVPGYNTYQGLLLLRGKLRHLDADVITVRFGWNDLAMSKEQAIGNAFEESDSAAVRWVEDLLLRTALYPFARRLGMEIRARLGSAAPAVPAAPRRWRPNVPLELFERNLRRIVDLGRERGSEVWLLTSPDPLGTEAGRRRYEAAPATSAAKQALEVNGLPSFERLAEIHAEYNDAVRRVAAETGATLVDLDRAFRESSDPAALFDGGDVMHPNEAGHQLEAEVLLRHLAPLLPGGDGAPGIDSPPGRPPGDQARRKMPAIIAPHSARFVLMIQ